MYELSIITVTRNSQDTITRTIKSVISQLTDRVEYIILDGASTDSTSQTITNLIPSSSTNIQFFSEADNGPYDAMNKSLSLAKGKYILFLHSDDWLERNAVKNVLDKIAETDADVVYGYLRVWRDEVEEYIYANHSARLSKEAMAHPSMVVKKSTMQKIGGFNTSFQAAADYDLMLKLLKISSRFEFIDSILSNFRLGGISSKLNSRNEVFRIQYNHNLISRSTYYTLRFKNLLRQLISY